MLRCELGTYVVAANALDIAVNMVSRSVIKVIFAFFILLLFYFLSICFKVWELICRGHCCLLKEPVSFVTHHLQLVFIFHHITRNTEPERINYHFYVLLC